MIDLILRAENEAHAIKIAMGAGVEFETDEQGQPISPGSHGTFQWHAAPVRLALEVRGVEITEEVEALLATFPHRVVFTRAVSASHQTGVDEDGEPTREILPGVFFALRIKAPEPAVQILVSALAAETWADGETLVLAAVDGAQGIQWPRLEGAGRLQ